MALEMNASERPRERLVTRGPEALKTEDCWRFFSVRGARAAT